MNLARHAAAKGQPFAAVLIFVFALIDCGAVVDGAPPEIVMQRLDVRLDLENASARIESDFTMRGAGAFDLRLPDSVDAESIRWLEFDAAVSPLENDPTRFRVTVDIDDESVLRVIYTATFDDDPAAGEAPGAIHNFAVQATVGADGAFLSEGSNWHPQPLDEDGRPLLRPMKTTIQEIDGWLFVASGNPACDLQPAIEACSIWRTPRPVEGVTLFGGPRERRARVCETPHGPVAVVAQFAVGNVEQAETFLDAACEYIALYTGRLGPFPYERFTIAENFFSSGFAYPGFTLLGPRVVAMGDRAARGYGYLDHEILHNWWGNGVYVDPDDGNWCEALATWGANYGRRLVDGGEDAGREYRRGVIMRASVDPDSFDNAALDRFGRDASVDRFVGYDKGAFVFAMLEDLAPGATPDERRAYAWAALRSFAESHLGRRAGWDELEEAFESAYSESLDDFFDHWVRRHTTPHTVVPGADDRVVAFELQYAMGQPKDHLFEFAFGAGGTRVEIDPEFRLYRIVPPAQLIPTLAGTLGPGGVRIDARGVERPELDTLRRMIDASAEDDDSAENLFLVGRDAFEANADLIALGDDSITLTDDGVGFRVGGEEYDDPAHAVLHTMAHPDQPGRFITVFLANGDAGWSRLRLAPFYSRDSTIVWLNDEVIERRLFEPDRRIFLTPPEDASSGPGG
ncbi:MAG: hypothetical protein ACF8PN_07520 [Phycisphaerales bacterium]